MTYQFLPVSPNAVSLSRINEVFSIQEFCRWAYSWTRVGSTEQWTSTGIGVSIGPGNLTSSSYILFSDNQKFVIDSYTYSSGGYGPSTETITFTGYAGWTPPATIPMVIFWDPSYKFSDYYAGVFRVPGPNITIGRPGGVDTYVPSSGPLKFSNFHSAYRPLIVNVAMVGGGGGGGATIGWEGGGGGGAGGYAYVGNFLLNAGTSYGVTVGAGGAFESGGTSSVFGAGFYAYGGGAGGYNNVTGTIGQDGGCGGGGTGHNGSWAGGSSIQPSNAGHPDLTIPEYVYGIGYPGGTGTVDASGGGGGGVLGAGESGSTYNTAATAGGGGTTYSIGPPVNLTYTLGKGGGGAGFNRYGTGVCGTAGGGYGGGGGGQASAGTFDPVGTAGVVIISYLGGVQRASGGTVYIDDVGLVHHVFTSSGYFNTY